MADFNRRLTFQDREHMRLDVHKVMDGQMVAVDWFAKWGRDLEGMMTDGLEGGKPRYVQDGRNGGPRGQHVNSGKRK